MTAFGMTKRAGRSADNDPGFMEVLNAQAGAVCLVGKSWDYHVDVALGISNDENLASIRDSVAAVGQHGREAMIDCEHFFDGYKANRDYALACATQALEAGARWVVLCDTNGGTLPDECLKSCRMSPRIFPATILVSIRIMIRKMRWRTRWPPCRRGCASYRAQSTVWANVAAMPIWCRLSDPMLKPRYAERFETGIDIENLPALRGVSNLLDELLNQTPNRHAPYVGASAFAHKGGIHVSAVMKDPTTYDMSRPKWLQSRTILVSDQAGKSNVVDRLTSAGIAFDAADPAIEHILREVKQKESEGYSYDGVARRLNCSPCGIWGSCRNFLS